MMAAADARRFCTRRPPSTAGTRRSPHPPRRPAAPLLAPPPIFWEVKPGFPRFHSP